MLRFQGRSGRFFGPFVDQPCVFRRVAPIGIDQTSSRSWTVSAAASTVDIRLVAIEGFIGAFSGLTDPLGADTIFAIVSGFAVRADRAKLATVDGAAIDVRFATVLHRIVATRHLTIVVRTDAVGTIEGLRARGALTTSVARAPAIDVAFILILLIVVASRKGALVVGAVLAAAIRVDVARLAG